MPPFSTGVYIQTRQTSLTGDGRRLKAAVVASVTPTNDSETTFVSRVADRRLRVIICRYFQGVTTASSAHAKQQQQHLTAVYQCVARTAVKYIG
jgi:hypothetical protein